MLAEGVQFVPNADNEEVRKSRCFFALVGFGLCVTRWSVEKRASRALRGVEHHDRNLTRTQNLMYYLSYHERNTFKANQPPLVSLLSDSALQRESHHCSKSVFAVYFSSAPFQYVATFVVNDT